MLSKKLLVPIILLVFTFFGVSGCDTTKNIYKSSTSKKTYVTINAVTLTHCGCTQIYAESFKNGQKEFLIFYNDNLARKTIYTYTHDAKTPELNYLLATTNDNFIIPFDELDKKIFLLIDSAIIKKQGIIYPIRRTIYKGYIADTLLRNW